METPGIQWELKSAFEGAPLLLSRLQRLISPHNNPARIIDKAREMLKEFSEDEKIAVLNSHARIGAGRSVLSGASLREQGELDPVTGGELAKLNDEYERRFGFRFVIFVNARRLEDIVPVLEWHLKHAKEEELASGLEEFLAIARSRLEEQRAR